VGDDLPAFGDRDLGSPKGHEHVKFSTGRWLGISEVDLGAAEECSYRTAFKVVRLRSELGAGIR
jgi:hypothetical protein